jgi:hypothetical protein
MTKTHEFNENQVFTIKETLLKIKKVADEILDDYNKKPPKRYNYNQYKVADIFYNFHLDGDEGYSVVICEISPTATKFQEYMVECLKDKLGFYVDVVLEW